MGVELLQILSFISYILAGVLFLVSVFLFFYLKVPALWGEVTGRTAKKAIRAMRWKGEDATTKAGLSNSADPNFIAKHTDDIPLQSEVSHDELLTPKERLPLVASEQKPPLKTAPAPQVRDAEGTTEDSSGKTGELSLTDVQSAEETAILSQNGETTALPIVGQTDVLSLSNIGQTDVLPRAKANTTDPASHTDLGETSVLSTTAYSEFVARSTGELVHYSETTLLGQAQNGIDNKDSASFCIMVKELAYTDSQEIIE